MRNGHCADPSTADVGTFELRSPDRIDRIEAEWRHLEKCCPEATPFQGFAWCRAWAEAAGAWSSERVRVVVVRDKGQVVLIWPLSVRRIAGVRVGRWLGEPLTQYGDVLAEPSGKRPVWLDQALAEIRSWGEVDLLDLGRLRAGAAVRTPGWLAASSGAPVDAAPHLRFEAGESAKARSRNTRAQLRKKWKRLSVSGDVAVELAADAEAREDALREALRLKRTWLDSTGRASSGLTHPAADACLLALARQGALRIACLTVGGKPAAYEVGFRRGNTYYSFLQAYVPEWSREAPGRLLTWQLLEACPSEGIATYDFLPPALEHKSEWASEAVPIFRAAIPLRPVGQMMAVPLLHAKPLMRDAFHLLPLSARRRLAGLAGLVN